MSRAELKIPVTCIFWRTEDGWRGECVELAAESVGEELPVAQSRLIAECYRVGGDALDRGQHPVRNPDELSDEARAHQTAVLKDGAPVLQNGLDQSQFRHVVMRFEIALQRDIEVNDDNLGDLRFVFVHSGKLWVAQCLEYDIGGEGESARAAANAAFDAITTQIAMDRVLGTRPLSGVPKAPEHYWKMYEQGSPIDIDKQDIEGKFRVAQAA